MNFQKYIWIIITIMLCTSFSKSYAQVFNTVGNGSIIAPAAGKRESYGINYTGGAESAFPTRHYHRGNETGIGGSFIGTTSPTSESSPARLPNMPIQTSAMQFHLPKLESMPSGPSSPALVDFTPALPSRPKSSALSSPITNPEFGSYSSKPGIERLPSYSGQPSVTDQLRFGNFDSFGK